MKNNKSGQKIKTIFHSQSLGMLVQSIRDGSFRDICADWKWILSFGKRYKGHIILYTMLGILSSLTGLASSVAGKYLIDIITGFDTSRLWLIAVIMLGTAVTSLTFSALSSRISAKLNIYINNDIQAELFEKLLNSEWLELNKFKSGDILNRFTSDVGTIASNAVNWIPSVIISLVSFVATLAVILRYDAVMALIAFISAPFLIVSSRPLIRKMREYSRKTKELASDMTGFEVEVFYNIDFIKSFAAEGKTQDRLRSWQEKYRSTNLAYNAFSIKAQVWFSALGKLVEFVAFAYCLWRLWSGAITFGTMTLFLQQRSSLSNSFSSLVSLIPSAMTASVSAGRIREIMNLRKELHSEENDEQYSGAYTVELNHVNFSYDNSHAVISDSSFVARPGEIIALVGPSGEGKTTMIRLTLGLVSPECGEVSMTDADGNIIPITADARKYFSYVPQGNTIMSGTIAENMRLVNENASDADIEKALRAACAWDFVSKLPNGINSYVGERGSGLSEGQAQRISIARAVLRNAPILLMDEATSALDVATERQVLRNIVELCPNKTCIVTTHRPSVLSLCKRVYRIVDARVTEVSEEESAKMVMDF
jgi:ABC-type multidrug transport system fused ATPase/permease subunit